jgi:hypothetical protein
MSGDRETDRRYDETAFNDRHDTAERAVRRIAGCFEPKNGLNAVFSTGIGCSPAESLAV